MRRCSRPAAQPRGPRPPLRRSDAQRVVAVGQRSRERSLQMQVANDVASAKELPSCEARPGRRVNNSASGKLQGGELREDCVEGALERGEASSAASALEAWSAEMPVSRLASCAATKAEAQHCICYLGVHLQGGQRAGVRLAGEGGVQGCRGDGVQESGRYLRAHLRGSVDGREQGVRWQGAGVRLGGLQPRDGGVSARELGGQRRGGDGPQESVGHLGVHLQRRDPRRYV